MSDSCPFLILEQPCDIAVAWVVRQVNGAGLKVMRTFDLQAAQLTHTECPCPHHGMDQCDCRMVVLLIYGSSVQPISLLAHSHDEKTWFSLVDTPQQRADSDLETTIRQALTFENLHSLNQKGWSHAS